MEESAKGFIFSSQVIIGITGIIGALNTTPVPLAVFIAVVSMVVIFNGFFVATS